QAVYQDPGTMLFRHQHLERIQHHVGKAPPTNSIAFTHSLLSRVRAISSPSRFWMTSADTGSALERSVVNEPSAYSSRKSVGENSCGEVRASGDRFRGCTATMFEVPRSRSTARTSSSGEGCWFTNKEAPRVLPPICSSPRTSR